MTRSSGAPTRWSPARCPRRRSSPHPRPLLPPPSSPPSRLPPNPNRRPAPPASPRFEKLPSPSRSGNHSTPGGCRRPEAHPPRRRPRATCPAEIALAAARALALSPQAASRSFFFFFSGAPRAPFLLVLLLLLPPPPPARGVGGSAGSPARCR